MDTPSPVTRLTDDERQFRATVREFAGTHVAPLVAEMDQRSEYCPKLVARLFTTGLMGIEVPRSYGGLGHGLFHVVLAIEELARVDPAVAVLVDVQNALVAGALLRWGSADQRRRHLPRLAGGVVGAYALSEREAGSDAFAMTTTARRDGDHFVLSGRKAWTTSAEQAELFLVFADMADSAGGTPRFGAFLVDRDTPGLTVGDNVDKMGIRASSTCELVLDGVRVGGHDLVGRPGDGAMLAVESLNIGKLGIAGQLVGLAQGALDLALRYARERRQFGRRIVDFQGVSFPLARVAADLEAARVLLYNTVRAVEHPETSPGERMRTTAMAKLLASDVAERAASCAVETLGGVGFAVAGQAEKLYRDAKVGRIYEGTSNLQLRAIAATFAPQVPGGEQPVDPAAPAPNGSRSETEASAPWPISSAQP